MVDAPDSKSGDLWSCGFKSRLRYFFLNISIERPWPHLPGRVEPRGAFALARLKAGSMDLLQPFDSGNNGVALGDRFRAFACCDIMRSQR
jgi:hypothetical protein